MESLNRELRVVVADDHDVVRLGLRALIDAEDGLKVVGEASDGKEVLNVVRIHDPDVVVMDVRMPGGGGVDACRELRDQKPGLGVIMMTAYSDDDALFNSIMAGAAGYLLKGVSGKDLVDSIRAVGEGKSLLDPSVTEKVLERIRHPEIHGKDPKLARLSPTEERVLDLVAEGLTNRQIGERIKLSDKTVKNYVSAILQKLDVARRSEAASYVTRVHTEQHNRDEH